MCGRYTIFQTGELARRFKVSDQELDELLEHLRERYNAAPGQNLPVVIKAEDKRHLMPMRWGLIPVWAKDVSIGYKLINARSESVFEKNTWKRPVLHARCLVPSNGFYEWKKDGSKKQPYFIRPKDSDLFAMAGVYSQWTDKATGEVIESFSILTTTPNKEMSDLHDRMPVILKPDDEERWLEPSNETPESIADLLKPYDDDGLEIYPVSSEVGNSRNEGEKLIHRLPQEEVIL